MLSILRLETNSFELKNTFEINENYIDLSKEHRFFAMIEPIYPQLCRIVKMNSKGLVIRYFKDGNLIDNHGKLDLMKIGNGFSNQTIAYTKIYDEIYDNSSFHELRECKISFKNVSYNQYRSIEKYIRNINNVTKLKDYKRFK